jgi:hypothetical protein
LHAGATKLEFNGKELLSMARRTFFSFHYVPDVWRAWNVRNSWVVKPEDEIDRGFFDSSVFEASKKEGEDKLKAFLRDGMDNTSVTCVLAGAQTWERRWVRYEIARSVLRGNGLLTVQIHGVKNKDGNTSAEGANPLAQMGVYKTSQGIYLAEWKNAKWVKYDDYTLAIPESGLWFAPPNDASVKQFSLYCRTYNFATENGRTKIGSWIEAAATSAGR